MSPKKAKDLEPRAKKAPKNSATAKRPTGDVILGRKLKAARMRYGLPMHTVMEETGISQATLSLIENGGQMPKLDTAAMLAYFYDVSLDGLCAHMKLED